MCDDVLLLRLFIIATAFTHLGDTDFCCCGDGMLSFLGELGSDEEMLDLLLLLDEEFSSFLGEIGPLVLKSSSPEVLDFLREILFTFSLDEGLFLFKSVRLSWSASISSLLIC